ncbi:valine--tRNA ligase [Candidatus Viadribacter manganicus]|uniref:Valine--tRNA ligase n=1 Tax=Candidatus Viadribacter manganicus TaxID=1759059 RepID=A0A1B1AMJ6_9PROT|nr:valine--tRNA ligase [Candidatus Viadribacter manganicus]ANP47740.1 valine--tRNA ligase [Candidatus Viadribacter manganicus]
MIETTFNPKEVEPRWSKAWEDSGAFKPKADPKADPFCIVIPPPNVTGSLHIGHALNNTLQDVLVRFERLRGKSVLWQPGTDHAGIATQMVVERQLAQSGANEDRRSLGREEFLKRVWSWKEESGGAILNQLRRLGASCDWSRERFTMDEGLSQAVLKVFVQLYKEGLIYKDKRLVNWDPHFETAISDLEVENREVQGHFWHFKYPLENGETYEFPIAFDEEGKPTEWETRNYIAIATTRPETMLGDGAVAVHPSDARYAPIVGKRVLLPLADRYIPIIVDEYPDPDFGSGAVKITGAHDFNDYQVARRNNIPLYILMDTKGRMADAEHVPAKYRGLDRFEARKQVVEDIEAIGLLDRIENKKIMQPFGDRSGVVIEPMLTDQWYVNAGELAKDAIAAVETGKTKFVPEAWTKTYYQWMRNIEPWCVSRQLWWGHRIPAWYGPDGHTFVEQSGDAAKSAARKHYGKDVPLRQDEDVLDTWFSSGLWPFSTLGWPQNTSELKKFYPTSTLVTAHDIIFFWVARMMMLGMHFMKEVPFNEVYIHALVRDAKGQKMSKSKGNTMDPLDLIDKFGADALRFTLAAMAAQGRDIKLSEQRIEGYRNFGTKLWNASRFAQMNECAVWDEYDPRSPEQTVNKWIVGETAKAAAAVTRELEARRFNEAAGALYKFVWNVYCDWYLEFIKPLLNGEAEKAKIETRRTAAWVLDQILIMLHPFMPFITEELWTRLGEFGAKRKGMLIVEAWPNLSGDLIDPSAEAEIDWMVRLIEETRSTRSELNVPAGAKIPLLLIGADAPSQTRLERYQDLIDRMARLEYSTSADAAPKGSVTFVIDGATVALPLQGVVDLPAESARLTKEIAKLNGELSKMDAKLGNADFIGKAPEEVVEELRERREDAAASVAKLSHALKQISA